MTEGSEMSADGLALARRVADEADAYLFQHLREDARPGSLMREMQQTITALLSHIASLATALERAEGERDALAKEKRALLSKPRPEAFDMEKLAGWQRLLREVSGYLNACRRDHHGTDFDGRMKAIDGLGAMANEITKASEAIRNLEDHGEKA